MSVYNSSEVILDFEVPQDYEIFSELFAPLGLFIFSFVRLEREISWSYVSANETATQVDTALLLQEAAKFEGSKKRTNDRISAWFKALREKSDDPDAVGRLNEIKKGLIELNRLRNRLVHDPSSGTHQTFDVEGASAVKFMFNRQLKSGETEEIRYSSHDLMQAVNETRILGAQIRQVTYYLFPNASNALF